MSDLSLRPRIRWLSTLALEEIESRLRSRLKGEESPVKGAVIRHHVILNLPTEQQHFWSPRLEVDLLKHERGVLVSGLLGPKPSVWAMLMFGYSFLAFVSLFGLISGLSDWSLGHTPYTLIVPIIGIAGCILLYGSVQGGKRLSQGEMHTLKLFLKETLGEVEEVSDHEDYEYFN